MAFNISIGDIMLLSSAAWRIGQAFTSGRKGAPNEFREVEKELNGLATAIDVLCSTLDEDFSLLTRVDENTRNGLNTILGSCQQTLDSLQSFVDRYQEIVQPPGGGGPKVRQWKNIFLRNYKTMAWTVEGGNIQALRNMLQMHVNSISLTVKALQSKSLARIEGTIEPMAQRVEGIHEAFIGNIDIKIAEMHDLMMKLATPGSSPFLGPQRKDTQVSIAETLTNETHPGFVGDSLKAGPSSAPSSNAGGTDKFTASPPASPLMHDSGFASYATSTRSDPRDKSDVHPALRNQPPSATKTPPQGGSQWSNEFEEPSSPTSDNAGLRGLGIINHKSSSSLRPTKWGGNPQLPPPAISLEEPVAGQTSDAGPFPAPPRYTTLPINVPSSRPTTQHSALGGENGTSREPIDYDDDGVAFNLPALGSPLTIPQFESFKSVISTDAATLFEGIASSVEYTQEDEDEETGIKMVTACDRAQISLIMKSFKVSGGMRRFVTSIWSLSEDRTTRLQHKLPDDVEIIPYTIYGNQTKVVVRHPSNLKYHSLSPRDQPLKQASTDWVNYNFSSERDAINFQNTLMGKDLLHTFKTRRTLRIFDTIMSQAFSYREQLCGLENLRLWADDTDSGGSGDGSVLAMIAYSGNYREGYLAFRLRGPYTTVQVKDDGDRWVRVKGLEVSLEFLGTDMRALKRRKSTATTATGSSPSASPRIPQSPPPPAQPSIFSPPPSIQPTPQSQLAAGTGAGTTFSSPPPDLIATDVPPAADGSISPTTMTSPTLSRNRRYITGVRIEFDDIRDKMLFLAQYHVPKTSKVRRFTSGNIRGGNVASP